VAAILFLILTIPLPPSPTALSGAAGRGPWLEPSCEDFSQPEDERTLRFLRRIIDAGRL